MRVIRDDILNIKMGIIVHQVNCIHVMSEGLGLQIRNRYPKHYNNYMSTVLSLGNIDVTPINNELIIIGICGQQGVGRGNCRTNYVAFERCLRHVDNIHKQVPGLPIFMPYKIGCGLSGGDWYTVQRLIEKVTPYAMFCYNGN